MDMEAWEAMRELVSIGALPDPTPFGFGGDHCPGCGADWKRPHFEECESPWAPIDNARIEAGRKLAERFEAGTARICECGAVLLLEDEETGWEHPDNDHVQGSQYVLGNPWGEGVRS